MRRDDFLGMSGTSKFCIHVLVFRHDARSMESRLRFGNDFNHGHIDGLAGYVSAIPSSETRYSVRPTIRRFLTNVARPNTGTDAGWNDLSGSGNGGA